MKTEPTTSEHFHLSGYYSDDTESGYVFRLSFWELVDQTSDRLREVAESDTEEAFVAAEQEDFERAWKMSQRGDNAQRTAERLNQVSGWYRELEAGRSPEDLAPAYQGEDWEEKLTISAKFSLGLIPGNTGTFEDFEPLEVWECVYGDNCEFITLEQWEEEEQI